MIIDQFLQQYSTALPSGSFLAFGVAIIAGILASAVCPCTVPVGLGVAGVVSNSESQAKHSGLWIAFSFFLGIVINLILLGLLASKMGQFMTESFGKYWALSMASLSLIAALFIFLGPRLKTTQLSALRMPGITGAFIYGFLFSLGTSAAPLLLLLTVSAAQGNLNYGFGLALFFGLGRGFPFLLIGVFAGAVMSLTRLSLWRRTIQYGSGGALFLVSGYYLRTFLVFI